MSITAPDLEHQIQDAKAEESSIQLSDNKPHIDIRAEIDPSKWYNKPHKIGPWTLAPYSSSIVQLVIISFVFFLCPGMFNALNGLGGGGQVDSKTAANGNVALYCTFATVGFFSGTISNRLGVQFTLAVGGIGYALYASSLLCYNHTQNSGFVIAAGAILGVCAACLWTAQGIIIMGYPTEDSKGRFVGIFWSIFSFGSVIGSLIPLIQTVHSDQAGSVSDGTYAGFLALMFTGSLLAIIILPSRLVVKTNGERVILKKNPTWTTELKGLYQILKTDYFIILLFPMFWSSNWFYTYQFNDFNLARFTLRTRSLNNLLYWLAQIVGAISWGFFLDTKRFSRKTRARIAFIFLFIFVNAIWGGGLGFQLPYTRESVADGTTTIIDWTHGGYVGPMFLYIFYGLSDAMWQTYIYWILGALTNSTRKLALYAGFYKGIQSAGAAVAWRLDAMEIPYINIFASSWALLAGSLIIAAPLIWFKVVETTDIERDIKFTNGSDISLEKNPENSETP